jgi:hypothetical protein
MALVIALALPRVALADTSAADKASAEALFNEGKRLMEAGQYAQACPKLADSQRLDPGVGTLLNLGVCYERNGQTASAWATFKEAASAAHGAGEAERERFARDRAAALEPKLAKLSVAVGADSVIDGLEVKRDGEGVPRSSWGLGLPIDPGDHTVEATAPGHKPWSTKVTVAASGSASVQVPALEPLPQAPAPPAAAPAPPPPAPTTTPAPSPAPVPQTVIIYQGEQPHPGAAQRTWGIVTGVFGLLAVGTSVAGGVLAKSEYDKSTDPNHGSNGAPGCVNGVCTQQGLQHQQDGQSIANVATWVFVGGAVFLAGGITLFVTAPSGEPKAPRASLEVAPTLGGAMVRGAW